MDEKFGDEMSEDKPTEWSLKKAAQAWYGEHTSGTELDVELATEFARILDEWVDPMITSERSLGTK